MTESLTERLQQRLSSQTAEIEALTSAELTRLANSLKQQSEAALRTMRSDIQDTSMMMADELEIMRWTARWWWVALIVTWLVIGGFSVWRWMQPATGIAQFEIFTENGQTFLLLPDGTEPMTCSRVGGTEPLRCVALPTRN